MTRMVALKLVDAFTDELFGGNPAGVVTDASDLSDGEMQLIAREVGASETAFVTKREEDGHFTVRFFTPTHEVDLCGHATIALFWVLAEEGGIDLSSGMTRVRQLTRAGLLDVEVVGSSHGPSRVIMTQVPPKSCGEVGWTDELLRVLGIGRPLVRDLPAPEIISTGLPDLIVPLPTREALWGLSPDLEALRGFSDQRDIISVHCVTTDAESDFDAHCRDFSPAVGVPEESATGTASGATAAYMVRHGMMDLEPDLTEISLVLEQGRILGRPSRIECTVGLAHGSPESIRVGGPARTVFVGDMLLDAPKP